MLSRTVIAAGALLISAAVPVSGQVSWGLHASKAVETMAGTHGAGAQARVGLPLMPIDAVGSVDYFRPNCPSSRDCSLWGWSVDARVRMPLPTLQPYATGGYVVRTFDFSDDLDSRREDGVALGVGAELNIIGAPKLFIEWRYEFVDSPSDQGVWRLGLYF